MIDNKTTINIAINSGPTKRPKVKDIKHHYLKQNQDPKRLKMHHVATIEYSRFINQADQTDPTLKRSRSPQNDDAGGTPDQTRSLTAETQTDAAAARRPARHNRRHREPTRLTEIRGCIATARLGDCQGASDVSIARCRAPRRQYTSADCALRLSLIHI